MQAVGAAQCLSRPVRSENASGCCSAHRNDKPADGGDAVDEDGVVSIEIFERAADRFVMRLRIAGGRRKRRIWSADPAGEIARSRPVVEPDRVDRHVLHREIAGLDIDEQRARRVERAQQRRLADAGRADDQGS